MLAIGLLYSLNYLLRWAFRQDKKRPTKEEERKLVSDIEAFLRDYGTKP